MEPKKITAVVRTTCLESVERAIQDIGVGGCQCITVENGPIGLRVDVKGLIEYIHWKEVTT